MLFLSKLFTKTKYYLSVIVGALLGLVGIYYYGINTGSKKEKQKQDSRNAKAAQQSKEIKQNVEVLDDDSLVDEFDRLQSIRRKGTR